MGEPGCHRVGDRGGRHGRRHDDFDASEHLAANLPAVRRPVRWARCRFGSSWASDLDSADCRASTAPAVRMARVRAPPRALEGQPPRARCDELVDGLGPPRIAADSAARRAGGRAAAPRPPRGARSPGHWRTDCVANHRVVDEPLVCLEQLDVRLILIQRELEALVGQAHPGTRLLAEHGSESLDASAGSKVRWSGP